MTPAEKAVIEAAKRWADSDTWIDSDRIEDAAEALQDAVAALRAEPAAEETRLWSLVVAEDEIYSTKTSKWYRVIKTVRRGGAEVEVFCEGMVKPFTVLADGQVKVRRSEMGKAVDVWAGIEVISS